MAPPIKRMSKPPFWSGQRPITRPVQRQPLTPGRLPDFSLASGKRPEFEAIRRAARQQKAALRRMR